MGKPDPLAAALDGLQPPPLNLAAYLAANPDIAAKVLDANKRGVPTSTIADVLAAHGQRHAVDTIYKWIRRQHG